MGTWEFRIPEIVLFRIARGRGLNNHDKTHLALVALTTVTRVRPRRRKNTENTSSALKKTPPAIEAYPPTRGRTSNNGGWRHRRNAGPPPRGIATATGGPRLSSYPNRSIAVSMLLKFQIVLARRMLAMSINSWNVPRSSRCRGHVIAFG